MDQQQQDEIEKLAAETAQMFFDEWGGPFDPAMTDWDSVAWDDDSRKLSFPLDEIYDEALVIYQQKLIDETRRLVIADEN